MGDRVRAALALAGVRQEDAAAAVGLTQSALSKRIAGKIDFRARELTGLADLCSVPVGSLFEDRQGVSA